MPALGYLIAVLAFPVILLLILAPYLGRPKKRPGKSRTSDLNEHLWKSKPEP